MVTKWSSSGTSLLSAFRVMVTDGCPAGMVTSWAYSRSVSSLPVKVTVNGWSKLALRVMVSVASLPSAIVEREDVMVTAGPSLSVTVICLVTEPPEPP